MYGDNVTNWEKTLTNLAKKNIRVPGMDYRQPGLKNYGVGMQMNSSWGKVTAVGAIGAGVVAGLASKGGVGNARHGYVSREELKRKAVDTGPLARMGGDAVGNVVNGKRDLGATGDIVFGLSNSRRGKYDE